MHHALLAFAQDDEVLAAREDIGIDCEQLLSVDREKVDEVLDVVEPSESVVYVTTPSLPASTFGEQIKSG